MIVGGDLNIKGLTMVGGGQIQIPPHFQWFGFLWNYQAQIRKVVVYAWIQDFDHKDPDLNIKV